MKYLSRSRNWRCPGVWSISEISRAGMHAEEFLEEFDDVGRRNLAAQMGLVIGAQQVRGARLLDRVGENHHLLADAAPLFVCVHADAKGIEHRRDARGGDLRVVGHHRAAGVPDDARARHVMGFEVVGVQLDEAGQQIVASAIEAAARTPSFADFDDASAFDDDVAGERPLGRHDRRVVEHDGVGQRETP